MRGVRPVCHLPEPRFEARRLGARGLDVLTDDALCHSSNVRIAFTGRGGGVSEGAFSELNLGGLVGDRDEAVAHNRALLLEALGVPDAKLVGARQVHGDEVVEVASGTREDIEAARNLALAGADALVVGAPHIAALLCFADCVPVIVVSPTGRFAVIHAGWRGAVAGIVGKAVRRLAKGDEPILKDGAAQTYNAYIGPHIHAECFETSAEVCARFIERFGRGVAADASHIDLTRAVSLDLRRAGLQESRIVDAGVCTACHPDRYFSYRRSGGVCGRHGACAVLQKG